MYLLVGIRNKNSHFRLLIKNEFNKDFIDLHFDNIIIKYIEIL